MTHLLDIALVLLVATLAAYIDKAPVPRWMRPYLFAVAAAYPVLLLQRQAGSQAEWWLVAFCTLVALPLAYSGYVWAYKTLCGWLDRPTQRRATVEMEMGNVLDEWLAKETK